MAIIQISELKKIRTIYVDKKIIFCSGGFDLTHAGHILFFEDCKSLGDILVVSVGTDASLQARKGDNRPILNEHIRLKTVDSLKPVDFCFINQKEFDINNKLATVELAFKELQPDIYVINEDAFDIQYRKELCSKYDIELVIMPRHCPPEFENISVTKIVEKIKSTM